MQNLITTKILCHFKFDKFQLRENYTPNDQNWACSALYLKIIHTFLKNNICIL